MEARDILIALAIKKKGNWEDIYASIRAKEMVSMPEGEKPEAITIVDPNYPSPLKNAYKPPFVIFTKGDTTLLWRKKKAALCVSREPSDEEERFFSDFLDKRFPKKDGVLVVRLGCLKKKCDMIARLVEKGYKIIGTLNRGIDSRKRNAKELNRLVNLIAKKGGLVLSTLPGKEEPHLSPDVIDLAVRIADCSLFYRVDAHSQESLFVASALVNNRDVYVVPHPMEETKGNEIIAEGAFCLTMNTRLFEESRYEN